MQTGKLHLLAAAFAAAALLAGCGGGGGTEGPRSDIQKVTVAGDSLADVGTFGMKFTVQNAADPAAGFPIFPQLVAQNFGIASQCNHYVATSANSFVANSDTSCTNYAIGGGRIVFPGGTDPRAVPVQLAQALQDTGGAWSATDLVIVDGGGNDASDLVGAYLGAAAGGAGLTNYQAFLAQQLDGTTIANTLPQPNGAEILAGMYMHALADTYYDAIKVNTLDAGATHVAVLDMPDITLTPRFQALLAGIAQAQGAATAAALQGGIQQWISAFNTQLATRVGSDARVALVPFYADFTDEVAHPADYGLTNATQAACPATGVDGSGLPDYDFPTCTSAALDAAPPAGLAAGWWQTWAFSDGFHPTPFGHRLLAASVSRAIARAGWL
jgi:phospholipase/lecithinase/hemolysin